MSDTASQGPATAVVCGGGVAGLAAAVALAERGTRVTLVEQRARLGGRASSVTDTATGHDIDNCQHVVMRACTALLDLYDRLGVADQIRWSDATHLVDPDNPSRVYRLAADDLPAPLHLVRPMLRMGMFNWKERVAISRGMLAVMQAGRTPKARARWNDTAFSDWLDEHHQPPRAVELFWRPIVVSACNEEPDAVATGYALQVFQDGLLATDDAYHIGLALCPLTELYGAAAEIIERAGGRVMTQTSVRSIEAAERRVEGVTLSGGASVAGDAYVLALPFDVVADLLPDGVRNTDARFQQSGSLTHTPIVGAHLFFRTPGERPLLDVPHLMLPGRRVDWLFDKGTVRLEGHTGRVAHVQGVISAAHGWMDTPNDEIADATEHELRRVLGDTAGQIQRVHHRVIKERHATFSIRPGSDAQRPPVSGSTTNLFLAGDWTQTGWPATMEGAARSGFAAAAAATGGAVDTRAWEREPELLYRVLAG